MYHLSEEKQHVEALSMRLNERIAMAKRLRDRRLPPRDLPRDEGQTKI